MDGKPADQVIVASDEDRTSRQVELVAEDRDAEAKAKLERKNSDFVQVYSKGWKRLQALIRSNPSAARVYAFLAEHVDGECGVVLVSQAVIAAELGVHERTIRRLTELLEDGGAFVRIKVGSGIYAYALDPTEVWRSFDSRKTRAAFLTRTLIRPADAGNRQVRRKLKMMMETERIIMG